MNTLPKPYFETENGVLYHGDCLEIMPKLKVTVDMVLCDPPYGTTNNKWDSIIPLYNMWLCIDFLIKNNGAIVMSSQSPFDKVLGVSKIEKLKYEWIWKKDSGTGFLNSKKMPLKNHENILIFYQAQPTYNPQMRNGFKPYLCKQGNKKSDNYGKQTGALTVSNGDRYPLTVLKFSRDKEKLHPTQKPISLFTYLILTYTNNGETVLDFCAGSGTTAIAAERVGRRWILIEKDEEYCEIAKKRIEQETKQLKLF